jgi:calcineurin-like phosphoesterase family protein
VHTSTNHNFYRTVLGILRAAEIPFLISGGFALEHFTGIAREIKDLDLFVLEKDISSALQALKKAGYRAELTFSHWLGKVYDSSETEYVDLIFSSGNGLCKVDAAWFQRAIASNIFEMAVFLCPPEEMIWQKAFIMERERYDGADVAHLIHGQSHTLDWQRLLALFDRHWRVLLSHLILFDYIYPTEQYRVPSTIKQHLLDLLRGDLAAPAAAARVCQGPFLSRSQFNVDVESWGYQDARLANMSKQQVTEWTEAAAEKPEKP